VVRDSLLTGLAEGREEAFAALYDRFGPPLFRFAWAMLRSRADAEDAVQEVFLGLARSRHTLRRIENLPAYLFGAVRHAVGRVAARRTDALPLPDRHATEEALDPALSDWLERALGRLPPEQREVLSLKIDGDLTFAEVAAVLGVSLNTAASRYRYALEKLRNHYTEEHHVRRPAAPG
jgi:RNA polymerase sigma-70 factor (ECF subfamily)